MLFKKGFIQNNTKGKGLQMKKYTGIFFVLLAAIAFSGCETDSVCETLGVGDFACDFIVGQVEDQL